MLPTQSEIDAEWDRFCREHLQPSRIFQIAVIRPATPDEQAHLDVCERCRWWVSQYSGGDARRSGRV